MLQGLRRATRSAASDEEFISALSDCIHEMVSINSSLSEILRLLLERTSAPWLSSLAAELGLGDDVVQSFANQPPDDEKDMADLFIMGIGDSKAQNAHGLMSDEDRAMIKDTKSSLRILRNAMPQESLCNQEAQLMLGSTVDKEIFTTARTYHELSASGTTEELAWGEQDVQHGFLALVNAHMSHPPPLSNESERDVREAVSTWCDDCEDTNEAASTLNFDCNPLGRVRPAIEAQNAHLNRLLLRHLFDSGLMQHLRIQRDYSLFGNGDFVTRLSTALFSADTQSAERKRGTIPTGQTMGLRLGARDGQRWPPASSELRLTLADVLSESYRSGQPAHAGAVGKTELPGGLSFSIRELPEEDIERVMDPTSIYALDFLRLQYTPPAPLDVILTPSFLETYDSIFRYLLRFLRVLHVTTSLRQTMLNHNGGSCDDSTVLMAWEAHSFVSTLLSHVLDVGIAAPWRALSASLETVKSQVEAQNMEEKPIGMDALRQMHQRCLETIRGRLFLRRKQEKIRSAVEKVLVAILADATILQRGGHASASSTRSGALIKELLVSLRATVDRPPSSATSNDGAEDDIENMRLLLARLDWNGYYKPTNDE